MKKLLLGCILFVLTLSQVMARSNTCNNFMFFIHNNKPDNLYVSYSSLTDGQSDGRESKQNIPVPAGESVLIATVVNDYSPSSRMPENMGLEFKILDYDHQLLSGKISKDMATPKVSSAEAQYWWMEWIDPSGVFKMENTLPAFITVEKNEVGNCHSETAGTYTLRIDP